MPKGWLEFKADFLAQLFKLRATGRARVDMESGKVQVEVEDARVEEGQILEGIVNRYDSVLIPVAWRPKGAGRATI